MKIRPSWRVMQFGGAFAVAAVVIASIFIWREFGAQGGGEATPSQSPKLTGRVIDEANLRSEDDERQLTANLKALEEKSTAQVVVVTVPSLRYKNIEDYARELGNYGGWYKRKK